ncbi:hypothetical protein, partial [Limosilactobacillus fermentum]|uniref:hypothetical protein n=1 Tax=Limosilactobacillus fermentum TaxID=1613 RepID=UPI0021A4798D
MTVINFFIKIPPSPLNTQELGRLTKNARPFLPSVFSLGRLQQLIEFFGQVTKEDLEWRFPPQTFP